MLHRHDMIDLIAICNAATASDRLNCSESECGKVGRMGESGIWA